MREPEAVLVAMRGRLLLPLLLTVAWLALAAPAALAAVPRHQTVVQTKSLRPGALDDYFVRCPRGYLPVAGHVVVLFGGEATGRAPGTTVAASHRSGPVWRFRVINYGPETVQFQLQVRCVRLFRGISVRSRQVARNVADGQPPTSLTVRCPRGYGPVGAGFSHSAPGKPDEPPSPGAFVHTGQRKPVRGGFRFRVENFGPDAARVESQANCVKRRAEGVQVTTVSATVTVEAHPMERKHSVRCPRGSLTVGGGWTTNEGSQALALAGVWEFQRLLEFIFSSGSPEPERIQLHALCLSETR